VTKETRELTPRQLSVLELAILKNRELGMRLRISEQTVKNHWSDILRAMGVQSRREAMIVALDTGLFTLEDFKVGGGMAGRRASVAKQPLRSWIGIGDPIPPSNY